MLSEYIRKCDKSIRLCAVCTNIAYTATHKSLNIMENFYEYIFHIIRSILRFHYYCEHDCCHDRIDGI